MSSLFDSMVYARRAAVPWFCRANVLEWMRTKAEESGEEVELTVIHRHSVATRFWYQLRFRDDAGEAKCVTSQDTDLLTWRADVADKGTAQVNLPRRCRIRLLFAWYDLWVGAFIDRKKRRIFVFLVPCVGIVIELPKQTNRSPA